jgi:hypothetical protein
VKYTQFFMLDLLISNHHNSGHPFVFYCQMGDRHYHHAFSYLACLVHLHQVLAHLPLVQILPVLHRVDHHIHHRHLDLT